ncbi:hypothetical protein BsIDN1_39050 [Bacillus safensis]|uniref:Uncharacterized protein n=1 Tax=Bacillus safensis TaxID=561879 RepID=A0A5S9M9W7_BACIA|nr:hypothetical protein BsIDN1_39050 [Bacillus safensis]
MTGHSVKVVTTLHGTDITVLGYDPSLKEVIRFAIESSDRVTAVSHSLAAQTYDLIKPDKKKLIRFITLLMNGCICVKITIC